MTWRYAYASVIGTSHQKTEGVCQDAGECRLLQTVQGEAILAAAVSDGAGSATYADQGAQLACVLWLNEIERLFETGGQVADITSDWVRSWLLSFQNEVRIRAEADGLTTRDFACTLLAAVVGEREAAFVQIGDGAIVYATPDAPDDYAVVYWPQQGEYVNQTFFATEPNAQEVLRSDVIAGYHTEIALFTDGLQSLVLHFPTQTAHSPFFRPVFAKLRTAEAGHSEGLSRALGDFLNSPSVNGRTDDDKTLVLATRRSVETALSPPDAPDSSDSSRREATPERNKEEKKATEIPKPLFIVIAGPNGAGKSTLASLLLPEGFPFVNADEIAKTLPGYPSPAVDVRAGRLMLQQMDELVAQRADFAIETTLASRTLTNRIREMKALGYQFQLAYVWIPDPTMSVARVASRVQKGGHHVPEETILRRYRAGLSNFFRLYQPIADEWAMYRNLHVGKPELIARGAADGRLEIPLPDLWDAIQEEINDAETTE